MSTSRGLLVSGGAATVSQLVRILALLFTHVAVARFMPTEEWGVWIWLEPIFLLLATVRDLGVPTHVMRLRPMPFGNFLRIELVWGAILGTALFVAAPWLAHGFSSPSPEIITGLRVLAVALVLDAAGAVALIWFEGTLRLERALSAELMRTAVYCVVALVGAANGWGFWAFVGGQVAGQTIFTLELWRRARREIVLHLEPNRSLEILRDSLPLGGVVLLTTAITYGDSFVVGRLFSPSEVAFYGVGYSLAFLVYRILKEPIGRSLYPALVELADRPVEQVRAFRLATVFFLALEVPAALLLAANAELVTLLLRGEPYLGAAPYLALLAFAPLVDPFGRFGGELLVARRLDRARVVALVLQLAALVGGGIFLCLYLESPIGMAWANFLPLGAPVVIWALVRSAGGGEVLRLLRDLVEVYLAPLLPIGLAWWLTADRPWLRLFATTAAAALGIAWAWYRHGAEFRAFFAAGAAASSPPAPSPHLESR